MCRSWLPKNCKGSQSNIGKVVAKKQNQSVGITAPVSYGWWEKFQKRQFSLKTDVMMTANN